MPKSHGCSGSLHPLQLCSYIIVSTLTASFYVLVIEVLPEGVSEAANSVYSVCLLGLIIAGGLSTFTDPTDYVVLAERKAKAEKLPFDVKPYSQICTICKTHVLEMSKHCGQCDRCVDGFDHHCKWLNNCVGSRNYRYFVVLISFLEALAAIQIAFSAYVVHRSFDDSFVKTVQERCRLADDVRVYLALLVVQFVISLALFLVIGQLIVLHIWLRAHGLTTYDYIVKRRQSKKSQVSPAEKEEEQDATTFHDNSITPPDNESSTASGSKTRLVLDKTSHYKRLFNRDHRSNGSLLADDVEEHANAYFAFAVRQYKRQEVVPEPSPPTDQAGSPRSSHS